MLIAVTTTLAGLAVEAGSGHQELGTAFAIGYALGCVAAVLAVRRSGIFTAVIQPPLLLFVAVPLAYYLFHNSSFSGLKEVAITCGYPLIERFPLMLFTSSAVLLIGLIRWYLAMAHPAGTRDAAPQRAGLLGGLSTKLSSAFAGNGSVDERPGQRAARPRHAADRSESGRRRRPPQGTPTRSRSGRPADESASPRPRRDSRRRPAEEWESDIPRRRSREPREPREPRRTPPPSRRDRASVASTAMPTRHGPPAAAGTSPTIPAGVTNPTRPTRRTRPNRAGARRPPAPAARTIRCPGFDTATPARPTPTTATSRAVSPARGGSPGAARIPGSRWPS